MRYIAKMNHYLLIKKVKDMSNKEKLISLNENLNGELTIQQLEERLETDPLAVGGLVDLSFEVNAGCFDLGCDHGFHIEF